MPVLYGVFLYMGVSSLKGIQVRLSLSMCPLCLELENDGDVQSFIIWSLVAGTCLFSSEILLLSVSQLFDRIKLFGMPAKHQPDLIYLRYVPLWKVHVFTLVQLSCLIILWAIKVSPAAVIFPMMVSPSGATCFTVLNADAHLHLNLPAGPGSGLHPEAFGFLLHQERAELAGRPDPREQEEEGRRQEEGGGGETGKQTVRPLEVFFFTHLIVSLQDAQQMEETEDEAPYEPESILKFPIKSLKGRSDPSEVNISDEMAKSGIWKSVSKNSEGSKFLKRCKRLKAELDGWDPRSLKLGLFYVTSKSCERKSFCTGNQAGKQNASRTVLHSGKPHS
ncbi:hypothetical protein XENOCAPTIV_002482 [Xenoophorus captivus]|uniref:Bicarbonate transporter-like transmembrane domain-containing protein n=1 Tax=Xenoophorus captivus TaxID=1517983 RepID=A0ABV0SCW6_9TELE